MTYFTIEIANQLINCQEEFPIDFDDAWQWLEYSRKDSAKRFLIDNAKQGRDFHIFVELPTLDNPRPSEKISLSIDGFKMWAMMSKTETGDRIRYYFLQCEKIAKQAFDQGQKRQIFTRDTTELAATAEKIEALNNETLKQLLRDALIDELTIKQGKRAIAPSKPQYTIAKVRATELGYSLTDIGSGTALGKWVAKSVPIAFQERVGKYTVNHYEVNDQLDTSINTFFSVLT